MNKVSLYKKNKKRKTFVDSQVRRFSILYKVYSNQIEYLKDNLNSNIPGLMENNEINKQRLIECNKRLELIHKNLIDFTKEQETLTFLLKELKKQR